MAKKKPNPSTSINEDILRAGIAAFLVLAAAGIAWAAMSAYVTGSGLFTVHRVTVAEGLGEINVPELKKLEGKNIFKVDLAGVEARVCAKYPQMAGLKVLRRFPDEILVAGTRRELFASLFFGGRVMTVSRDGFIIGPWGKEDPDLVLVKGVVARTALPGEKIADPHFDLARQLIDLLRRDDVFGAAPLHSVDVQDAGHIVCVLGRLPVKFDVVIDGNEIEGKIKMLSMIIGRTGIALPEVKYIDLRFKEPVIGKKKAKK